MSVPRRSFTIPASKTATKCRLSGRALRTLMALGLGATAFVVATPATYARVGFAVATARSAQIVSSVEPVLYTSANIADWKRAAAGTGDRRTEWNHLLAHAVAELTYQPTAPAQWGSNSRTALRNDATAALHEGVAYAVTGNSKYATAARRILLAWAKITVFHAADPNWRLNFVFHHESLVYAAGLIRTSSVWSATDEAKFRSYLRGTSTYNTLDRDNNWASWGVAHLSSVGAYLNDTVLMNQAAAQLKRLIDVQVEASPLGQMIDCYHASYSNGSRCKWYSTLSFDALALSAQTLKKWGASRGLSGFDLWDYKGADGAGLQAAYMRLMALHAGQPGFPIQDSYSAASNMVGGLWLAAAHWHSPYAAKVFAGVAWSNDKWNYGGMVHPKLTLDLSGA